jgi:uncharacterized membrane protein|nr:MAG TPA: Putative ABC-transporter type IV [Caudoviricetes sp.]
MISKYAFLFWFGGATYAALEVLWRGYSHWTMLLLAGVLFIIVGLLNEIWSWEFKFRYQVLISTGIATILELLTGLIVNIWLKWDIWDYSNVPFNFLGQICLPYTVLWTLLSAFAIVIDDVIRWKFFGEEKPHYIL